MNCGKTEIAQIEKHVSNMKCVCEIIAEMRRRGEKRAATEAEVCGGEKETQTRKNGREKTRNR